VVYPNYGEYFAVFAGVTYYLAAVDDLEDLDRLLYKKNQSDGSEREV